MATVDVHLLRPPTSHISGPVTDVGCGGLSRWTSSYVYVYTYLLTYTYSVPQDRLRWVICFTGEPDCGQLLQYNISLGQLQRLPHSVRFCFAKPCPHWRLSPNSAFDYSRQCGQGFRLWHIVTPCITAPRVTNLSAQPRTQSVQVRRKYVGSRRSYYRTNKTLSHANVRGGVYCTVYTSAVLVNASTSSLSVHTTVAQGPLRRPMNVNYAFSHAINCVYRNVVS